MSINTYINIFLGVCMIMLIPWVNVNLHCYELDLKEQQKLIQSQQKQIIELKQQVQKMDSCKVHVHYHYEY